MKVSQLQEELAQALVVGWNYHLDMEREILLFNIRATLPRPDQQTL